MAPLFCFNISGPIFVKIEPELIEDMEVDVRSIKIESFEDIFEEDLVVDEDGESLENPDPIQATGSSIFMGRDFTCQFCYKEFLGKGTLPMHIQNRLLV